MAQPKFKKEKVQEEISKDSVVAKTTQRFGLFSQPFGIFVGDDTYTKEKKALKDQDGRVPTGLPQINTSPMKKGHTDNELFSSPGYITKGDPYIPKKPDERRLDHSKVEKIHEGAKFKGSGMKPEPIKTLFEHMPQYEIKEKNAKLIKDQDGRVVTQPKNFYTTGAKKGGGRTVPGTLFNKEGFEYIESDYEREKELRRKEREYHISKLQEGRAFCPMHNTAGEPFNNIETVYGGDEHMPHKKPKPKEKPQIEHESVFKPPHPPKVGYNKTLGSFPEYVPNGVDKKKVEKMHAKITKAYQHEKTWKPTHNNNLSRPNGTVATNTKNLRAEFPKVFRR